jgi:acetyltransferase EpsM
MTKLVILGAGGDGLVIAEAARAVTFPGAPCAEVVGFLDDAYPAGGSFEGYPVFGALDAWRSLPPEVKFVPAVQKVGDMPRRMSRLDGLGIPRERWATVVHPTAMVASSAQLGAGVYIAAFCSVQPRCAIGDFASLRAGAALGHGTPTSARTRSCAAAPAWAKEPTSGRVPCCWTIGRSAPFRWQASPPP